MSYVCCAMIIELRKELIGGDFAHNLHLLQNYPSIDVISLLHKAMRMRARDAHVLIPRNGDGTGRIIEGDDDDDKDNGDNVGIYGAEDDVYGGDNEDVDAESTIAALGQRIGMRLASTGSSVAKLLVSADLGVRKLLQSEQLAMLSSSLTSSSLPTTPSTPSTPSAPLPSSNLAAVTAAVAVAAIAPISLDSSQNSVKTIPSAATTAHKESFIVEGFI